jgi:tetratricopeptide (TPR) repeat protein
MQRFVIAAAALALLVSTRAGATRPPIQQDADRCTLRQENAGAGSVMQGTIRLQLLVRANGRPYAAFVWSERGIENRALEGCLVNVVPIWELPTSKLDYAWPYPITFAPGGTDQGGTYSSSLASSSTAQGRTSAFLPDFSQPPPPEPLNVKVAQATLDIVTDATAAEQGMAEMAVKRYPQAIQQFRSALAANSTDPMALRGLAQALAESGGDLKEARALAEKLVGLMPDSEQGHEAMLRVCLAANDDPCAVQQFNAANRSKDLSLRYLVLRDELQPRATEASKRVHAAMVAAGMKTPQLPQQAVSQDPCAAEKGDEQQALCVVRRCLDEGTVLYARELSDQNHIPYDVGDWRVRSVGASKLLVIRPIAPRDRSKDTTLHDAIWLVKLGDDLVMQPSSPEARQITLQHNRCTARASR